MFILVVARRPHGRPDRRVLLLLLLMIIIIILLATTTIIVIIIIVITTTTNCARRPHGRPDRRVQPPEADEQHGPRQPGREAIHIVLYYNVI